MACFQLDLKQKLDLKQSMLAISINQGGDRLGTQHNIDSDRYIPSVFSIALIRPRTQTQPGKVIRFHTSEDRSF